MTPSKTDVLELALKLRSISRDDGSIDAAQVRVIGLDEIRHAAGPNWPRMRERVRHGSMQILARYTGSDDVIVPAGDGFLVILAPGAPGNNQERCNRMREALLSFYLGEETLASLRATVMPRSLTREGFADLIAADMQNGVSEDEPVAPHWQETTFARVFAARPGKIVADWVCSARGQGNERRLAYNPDYILDGSHHERSYCLLDTAILDQAAQVLAAPAHAPSVGFTVHATTLRSRRNREAYLSLLSRSSCSMLRSAIITIAEIEKGTPLISIEEWCHGLRPLVSHVCLDFHYTDHALSSIGGTGAWAAGFHLPIYSGAQCGPRAAQTLDHVRFWSKTVHSQGMRLAVNGFKEAGFLQQALAAGVDLATSNVLWPFAQIEQAREPRRSELACA